MTWFVENPWIDGFIVASLTTLLQAYVFGEPADVALVIDFVGMWVVVTTFRILDQPDGDERR